MKSHSKESKDHGSHNSPHQNVPHKNFQHKGLSDANPSHNQEPPQSHQVHHGEKEAKDAIKNDAIKEEDKVVTISSQTILIGLLVVLAVGLAVWKVQSSGTSPEVPLPAVQADEPVARVNGETIMRSEIQHQLDKIPMQLRSQISFDEILNSTIRERLLLKEAKREGIEVSKPEAGAYLAMMMNNSGMSKEELGQRAKEKGISEDEILDIVQRRLIINGLLQQEVFLKIMATDDEVKDYYNLHKKDLSIPELVHAKHILLAQSEEANATLNRLKKGGKGADFETLAKDLSLDKGSAKNGGDLGNFTRGMMVPEFEKAAFDAMPGDLVGPVKTSFGYHIIKVLSHSKGKDRSLAEVSDAIKRKLKSERSEAASNAYVEELRKNATIEILMKK